jgi:hypothetical protein
MIDHIEAFRVHREFVWSQVSTATKQKLNSLLGELLTTAASGQAWHRTQVIEEDVKHVCSYLRSLGYNVIYAEGFVDIAFDADALGLTE